MCPALVRDPPFSPRFVEESPLFWPIAPAAATLAGFAAWPTVEDVDAALAGLAPVRFEAQAPKPRRGRRAPVDARALYDGRIHLDGVVPTRRRNWHDLLNALCWATFARSKPAIHARQHAAIAARVEPGARTLPGARTRELDGLALLDEGGMLLVATPRDLAAARAALEARDAGPIAGAIAEGRAVAIVYGHAVFEHFLRGEGAVRAMTHLVIEAEIPDDPRAQVALADARLAGALADPASFADPGSLRSLVVDERLAPRPRAPA